MKKKLKSTSIALKQLLKNDKKCHVIKRTVQYLVPYLNIGLPKCKSQTVDSQTLVDDVVY